MSKSVPAFVAHGAKMTKNDFGLNELACGRIFWDSSVADRYAYPTAIEEDYRSYTTVSQHKLPSLSRTHTHNGMSPTQNVYQQYPYELPPCKRIYEIAIEHLVHTRAIDKRVLHTSATGKCPLGYRYSCNIRAV